MPQSPVCQNRTISEPSCGHADWACSDMSLGLIVKSRDPASSPSVAILEIILVLHGAVFPLGSIKLGMVQDFLYRMRALQTGPSGGQSLRPQGYAFLTGDVTIRIFSARSDKRLCYCRGTARRATSVEILWPFFD